MAATIIIKNNATSVPDSELVPHPDLIDVEIMDDIIINPELPDSHAQKLLIMVKETCYTFTNKCGKTSLCEFIAAL